MSLLAVSIHIDSEGRVPKLRQHPCALTHVVVVAPPLVDDKHPGAFARYVIVVCQKPMHHDAVAVVTDLFGM